MTEGVVQRTRQELLHELESSQAQVAQLLESMAAVQDWQPDSAEWSFRLLAGHLATVEEAWHLHRIQTIADGARPTITPYADQAVDCATHDLRESIRRWVATRRRLLDFVAARSDHELHQTGVHATLGPMNVLDVLAEILRQDQGNLRHIHQLIVAYYESPQLSVITPALPAHHNTVHHNEAR